MLAGALGVFSGAVNTEEQFYLELDLGLELDYGTAEGMKRGRRGGDSIRFMSLFGLYCFYLALFFIFIFHPSCLVFSRVFYTSGVSKPFIRKNRVSTLFSSA